MNRVLATAAILSLTLAPVAFAQSQTPQGSHPSSNMTSGSMSSDSMSKQNSGAMRATPEQVKQVQAELKSQGLYKGRVDGEAGKQTMAALSSYQKSKGLQPTGKIDQQTLDSLSGSSGSSGSDSMGGAGSSGGTQQQ
jgi:peptidoglycan hydrolase-like protein with peptidoglycan-binding domain